VGTILPSPFGKGLKADASAFKNVIFPLSLKGEGAKGGEVLHH